MSFVGLWQQRIGHEALKGDTQFSFYQPLIIATVILRERALHFLMAYPVYRQWLSQVHEKELLLYCARDAATMDPNPSHWQRLLVGFDADQQRALTAMRPFTTNASNFYRHHCDQRADEMDCNEIFTISSRTDQSDSLRELLTDRS